MRSRYYLGMYIGSVKETWFKEKLYGGGNRDIFKDPNGKKKKRKYILKCGNFVEIIALGEKNRVYLFYDLIAIFSLSFMEYQLLRVN